MKTNKLRKRSKSKKTPKLKTNSKHVCIFKKCPKDSINYNWYWDDIIQTKNGDICYFDKCHKGGTEIISHKGKKLCAYDTCPSNAKKIDKNNIEITDIGKKVCIYDKNHKCKNGIGKSSLFGGEIKLDGKLCFSEKPCHSGGIKLGKNLCINPEGCPPNTSPFSINHII